MAVDLGPVDSFQENAIRVVVTDRHEVGVFKWRGALYAIRNYCCHQGGPICRGSLTLRIASSSVGEVEIDQDTPVLLCPWHNWEFDPRTGRALIEGDRFRLKMWPIRVADEHAFIDL